MDTQDRLAVAPKRSEVEALMKRCQIGVGGRHALDNEHSIMAVSYGTLGALMLTVERLRARLLEMEAAHEHGAGTVQAMQQALHEADFMLDHCDELDAEGHDGSRERRGVVMTNSKRIADVAISSDQLRAYLQIKHWREDGRIRSVATVWHRADDEDAEVLLPISQVKDYRQRMRDALQAVATFEARDVPELLKEVKQLFANVIAVRVISEDTNDGTIPIHCDEPTAWRERWAHLYGPNVGLERPGTGPLE